MLNVIRLYDIMLSVVAPFTKLYIPSITAVKMFYEIASKGVIYNHNMFTALAIESFVSDAKIWSITQESQITILEASFTLNYDDYSTGREY